MPGIGTFGQFQLESNGSVLVVRSVNETDEGDFQCHASNIAGMTFDTVSINVIGTFLPWYLPGVFRNKILSHMYRTQQVSKIR